MYVSFSYHLYHRKVSLWAFSYVIWVISLSLWVILILNWVNSVYNLDTFSHFDCENDSFQILFNHFCVTLKRFICILVISLPFWWFWVIYYELFTCDISYFRDSIVIYDSPWVFLGTFWFILQFLWVISEYLLVNST